MVERGTVKRYLRWCRISLRGSGSLYISALITNCLVPAGMPGTCHLPVAEAKKLRESKQAHERSFWVGASRVFESIASWSSDIGGRSCSTWSKMLMFGKGQSGSN